MSEQVAIDFGSIDTDGGSPPGWAWATLIDLVAPEPNAMTDGPFGSKLKSAHYVDSGVRVVRLGNLGVGEFKHGDKSFVSPEHAATLRRHALEAGDLLIAALAEPVGRACQAPASILPAIVKADCIRYKPHPGLSPKFVMHWLNSPRGAKNAEAHSHGVGRLRINMKNMRGLAVPVAPFPEQHRIVAEIEKQFTRLDAAVANLERVKANLKRARASILKAAVEGRLVPTEAELARAEGRDYEPASVLLERTLEERKRKHDEAQEGAKRKKKYKPPVDPDTEGLPELPEGWVWASAEQLFWDGSYGTSVKCNEEVSGAPVLRIPNVQAGAIQLSDLKYSTDDSKLKDDGAVAAGDFIFIRTNGSRSLIGRGALVVQELSNHHYASYLIRLRLLGDTVLQRWVAMSWHGPGVREQVLADAASSAGQYNVSLGKAKSYHLAVPPRGEQGRILDEADRRFSVINALQDTVEANLARCNRLRQSILKRAFEGKLVPQDPNDEPASGLLARIQAEAEAAKTTRTKKNSARKKAAKKKATGKKKTTA